MDKNSVKEWDVVYLKNIKFPDNNKVDTAFFGRPFVVYKKKGDKVFLFGIREHSYRIKEFFYPIIRQDNDGNPKKCVINLKNYIVLDIEEFLNNANALSKQYKNKNNRNNNLKYLTPSEIQGIKKQIEVLCLIDEYRKKIQFANKVST